MKKGLIFGAGLLAGVAGGGAAAWFMLKQKYEQRCEEEIAEVRASFQKELERRRSQTDAAQSGDKPKANGDDRSPEQKFKEAVDYVELAKRYTSGSITEAEKAAIEKQVFGKTDDFYFRKPGEPTKPSPDAKPPYVITPMDFADPLKKISKDVTLKYYNDGAIVGENGKPLSMEELDRLVGREALLHFGEYEEDSVCVRNEGLDTDFQILMTGINWAEARKQKGAPG